MKKISFFTVVILVCLLCISCAPSEEQASQQTLTLQYTFSTQPWLEDLFACAGRVVVLAEQRSVGYMDIFSTDMAIRIGDNDLQSDAYKVSTEDLVVIVNPDNPVDELSAAEIHSLFTGTIQNWESISGQDASVQVWVFSSGEDIQQAFGQYALSSSPVSTEALLASNSAQMLAAVATDEYAIGFITRSFLSDQVSEAYLVASLPVLVLLPPGPSDAALAITACLQK